MSSPHAKLDEMTEALRAFEPRLDDLARARIEARLAGAIDIASSQERSGPRRRPIAAAAAFVLASAAAALLLIDRRPPERVAPPSPRATANPQNATPAAPAPVPRVEPPALIVYALAGAAAADLAPQLGRPQTEIALRDGAVALASIGGRARLTLIGPARLRTVVLERERIEIALDGGELAVDYDRRQGGELIVHGPRARVRVIGTRFGVRVGDRDMRVGVAHGTVEVDTGRDRLELTDGQGWRAPAAIASALSPAMKRRLDAHAMSVLPPPAEHTLLKVAGTPEGATAHLGPQRLGETPVWALVPIDAVDVSLRRFGAATPAAPRESAAMLYARAEACLRARDRECAARELRALIARYPESEEAEPALYELVQGAPDCASAVPWLQRYLARYPEGRFAAGGRQRLVGCEPAPR